MKMKRITTGLAAGLALVSLGAAAQNSATEVSERIIPITYYLLNDGEQINTNTAPTVNWVTPNQNQEYTVGDTINVAANASDVDGVVVKVDLRVGSEVVGSDSTPPYSWDSLTYSALSQLSAGTHSLNVVATDNYGKTSAVATRDIRINALNVLPEVSFSLPAVTSVVEGTAVQVEVDASDADGSIASVQLLVDGNALRTERNAPYNWNKPGNPGDDALVLSTLSVGEHELTVIVTDNAGGQQTATQTITITPVFVDTDGDGVADSEDAFPNDPTETTDGDGDGVGDNADAFPNDPTRSENTTMINLDFGSQNQTTISDWNAITNITYSIADLVDNAGNASGIAYRVSDTFRGYGNINLEADSSELPAEAISDATFNRDDNPTAEFSLSGLDADKTYTLNFYATHGGTTENRQAAYSVSGDIDQTVYLNPVNDGGSVSVSMQPNNAGDISVRVEKGPDNVNSLGIHYLSALTISTGSGVPPVEGITECNDGIDNDGDGLTDWQLDIGCWGAGDNTETAGTREQENGWTTFDKSDDSIIYYVSSSDGNDSNNGTSPETALATPRVAWNKLRNNSADIILLKRGDVWRDEILFDRDEITGRNASERIVISSYGESTKRPVIETSDHFINSDRGVSNLAVVGLALVAYKKEPNTLEFDGKTGSGIRFALFDRDSTPEPDFPRSNNVLFEDMYLKYTEIALQSVDNIDVRRNVIHKSYEVGTCFVDKDENGNVQQTHNGGDFAPRPSGIYVGGGTSIVIEGNVFDHNGWNVDDVPFNPDAPLPVIGPFDPAAVEGACATDRNHNIYVTGVKDSVIRNNVLTRSSFAGIKVSGTGPGSVDGLIIEGNLLGEGALGINMAGNGRVEGTHLNTIIQNNVFTDIGRSTPTGKELSWGIWFMGNDQTIVKDNLFVNPPAYQTETGAHALYFGNTAYNRNILVENNIVHNYSRVALLLAQAERDNILFQKNTFHNDQYEGVVDKNSAASLINHYGDFSSVNYSENRYFSKGIATNPAGWFLINGSSGIELSEWQRLSGELDASVSNYIPVDAGRNIDSYAVTLGIGNTIKDFAEEAIKQSRFNWRSEYEAKAVNAYIREGYADSNN